MADNLSVLTEGGVVAVSTRDRAGVHIQGVAGPVATATSTGYNATPTSSQGLASNAGRLGLIIQNLSDVDVIGAYGATPVATAGSEVGFLIPAKGKIEFFQMIDTRAVNVVHAYTGNKRLLFTEFM